MDALWLDTLGSSWVSERDISKSTNLPAHKRMAIWTLRKSILVFSLRLFFKIYLGWETLDPLDQIAKIISPQNYSFKTEQMQSGYSLCMPDLLQAHTLSEQSQEPVAKDVPSGEHFRLVTWKKTNWLLYNPPENGSFVYSKRNKLGDWLTLFSCP